MTTTAVITGRRRPEVVSGQSCDLGCDNVGG
jgi:hypothetical protein